MKPYETPTTDPSVPGEQRAIPRSRGLAITGVLLLTVPLFAGLRAVIPFLTAYQLLKNDANADTTVLTETISMLLMTMMYGTFLGIIGVLLVSLALFRNTNREPWFFWSVLTLAILWGLLLFPIGLIPAIYLLVIFGRKKREFFPLRNHQ